MWDNNLRPHEILYDGDIEVDLLKYFGEIGPLAE